MNNFIKLPFTGFSHGRIESELLLAAQRLAEEHHLAVEDLNVVWDKVYEAVAVDYASWFFGLMYDIPFEFCQDMAGRCSLINGNEIRYTVQPLTLPFINLESFQRFGLMPRLRDLISLTLGQAPTDAEIFTNSEYLSIALLVYVGYEQSDNSFHEQTPHSLENYYFQYAIDGVFDEIIEENSVLA